jgi:predicted amidophosphoribosyltransferase
MRGAFQVRRPEVIAEKHILLIDDVFTTGATVQECSRVLLKAGAKQVDVLTLARALRP